MTSLINFLSSSLNLLFGLINFLIFPALLVWMIMAFRRKDHPNYKIDESGEQYCPAMRDLQQIKKNRFEMKENQREMRMLGKSNSSENIVAHSTGISVADEIEKLAALKTQGHLTEQEFIDKKQKLLS